MTWLSSVSAQGRRTKPGRRGASDPSRRTSRVILPRISPLPRVNLRGELGIQRARCHVIPFQRNVTRPATPLRALPKRAGVRRACRACPSCPGASPFWPATMPPSSPGRAVSAGSRTALAGGPRRFNRRPQRLERKALQLRSAALSPRPTAPPAWDGAGGGLGGALPAPISPPRRGQGPFGSPKDPPPPLPPPADAPAAAARPSRLRRRCDLHARCAGSHVHKPLANLLRTRAAIRSAAYGGASSGSSIGGSGTKNGGGCSRSFCFGSGLDHSRPHTACFSSGIQCSRAPATASVTSTSSCMPRSG